MTGAGAVGVADALLRGGAVHGVKLRLAGSAIAGAVTEQLGLEAPAYDERELWPVAVLSASGAGLDVRELVVGARAVASIAGDKSAEAGEAVLRDAVGVVVGGDVFLVSSVTAEMADGTVYCFRVRVTRAG